MERFIKEFEYILSMRYITPSLLDKIDRAQDRLERRDLRVSVDNAIADDANYHSDKLEHPGRPNGMRHATLDNLTHAWDWAKNNFEGVIDEDLMHRVVNMIEPKNPDLKRGYRGSGFTQTRDEKGNTIMYPRGEKISLLMIEALGKINEHTLHPVERAALAHFHIARIHPYADGNGRTARLLQNIILRHFDYAPITIQHEERDLYLSLIDTARKGFLDRDSKEMNGGILSEQEKCFFDYLGNKALHSLGEARRRIINKPKYYIFMDTDGPGQTVAAKRSIMNQIKGMNKSAQVRIKNRAHGNFSVQGDLTIEEIHQIVGNIRGYTGKCEIVASTHNHT